MFAQTQADALSPWMFYFAPLLLTLLSLGGWYGGLLLGTRLAKVGKFPRSLIVLLLDMLLLCGASIVQELVLVNNYFALTSIVFAGLLGAHLGVALAELKLLNKLESSESSGFRFAIIAVVTLLVFGITQSERIYAQQATLTQQVCAIASGANAAMLLLTGVFVAMVVSGERRKLKVVRTSG